MAISGRCHGDHFGLFGATPLHLDDEIAFESECKVCFHREHSLKVCATMMILAWVWLLSGLRESSTWLVPNALAVYVQHFLSEDCKAGMVIECHVSFSGCSFIPYTGFRLGE